MQSTRENELLVGRQRMEGKGFTRRGFIGGAAAAAALAVAPNAVRAKRRRPPVVVDEPPAWAVPTPRAKTVKGQINPPFVEDTFYEDCTGLVIPVAAKRFTVVGGNNTLPFVKGWQDFWFGGRPGQWLSKGPKTNGDLIQVKRSYTTLADPIPLDGVFAWIDFHGVYRQPTTENPDPHPDGVQQMAGQRITYGGCLFRDMDMACQPLFISEEAPSAGGGPIGDVLIDDCHFSDIRHYYSMNLGRCSGPITVRNCDLGGKNALGSSAYQQFYRWESSNRNGIFKLS
jgi:hypothetical protein